MRRSIYWMQKDMELLIFMELGQLYAQLADYKKAKAAFEIGLLKNSEEEAFIRFGTLVSL